MKTLANATVTKLREYSRSYGKPETISVAYILEFDNYIQLHTETGYHLRTLRKGTRLLISFDGQEISERAYNLRTNKAKAIQKEKQLKIAEEQEIKKNELLRIVELQKQAWTIFLTENPAKIEKYKAFVNSMPSSKWRNKLKMKAAKHINNGKFEGLEISAPDLNQILFNF